jgi:hypothetical protein
MREPRSVLGSTRKLRRCRTMPGMFLFVVGLFVTFLLGGAAIVITS